MPKDEFSLIRQYFSISADQSSESGVVLGIGDDCALLRPRDGEVLAVTTDTLIEGVHFPANAPAEDIAQRALRVNLSDIAAMGAEPRWFQLALTLPEADDTWLRGFSGGLFAVAKQYACHLVGGDTTRGPLVISITMFGAVPAGSALTRSGAQVGDKVFVTGKLGLGAAGLECIKRGLFAERDLSSNYGVAPKHDLPSGYDKLWQAFWRPQPRLQEGQCLRTVASAAIDIADGLMADLGHLTGASDVGAIIYAEQLPLLTTAVTEFGVAQMQEWALSGGDDYELCFTVPPEKLEQLQALRAEGVIQATEIGEVVAEAGVKCLDARGHPLELSGSGYTHF